ncbi:putative transcription factor MADS-type1 family [Medicago truncatula]|uniref:MADS-box transcription factor family protein, putative n=1 Tax=Medicago truncatula TaxID=3880 RepID=A0A072V0I7_MEDTR|nr:uncharacterized protein LOC120579700 [Medicago truncatula]KEH35534.1 MADS-box transcription factor family protein, putative [Medicago truncatula]RHN69802.1 putative transcription factor MADS-type1 family [Medicago truncatula]
MVEIRKRKITSKLIENATQRKIRYMNRVEGLFTKMEQVKTLCGIEACAIVFGPGDSRPSVWPSPHVAKKLIHKFEYMPTSVRSRNMTDQLTYVVEKGKKLDANLAKINKYNEETLLRVSVHQILNEGKSISDFNASMKNNLIDFLLERIKIVRKKTDYFEKAMFPLNKPPSLPPPMSCAINNDNMTDFRININKEVLNQQPLLDLAKQVDQMGDGFNPGGGGSVGDMLVNQENFEGFYNNIYSNTEIRPHTYFGGGVDLASSQGNLKDFDSRMEITSDKYLNGSVDDILLPRGNSGGFDASLSSSMEIPPHVSHGDGVDIMLPQGNFGGFELNTSGNMWIPPHENSSGNVDALFPHFSFRGQNNFESFDKNTGSNMWTPSHENPNVDVDALIFTQNYGGQCNFEGFDNITYHNMWTPSHENPSDGVEMFIPNVETIGQGSFKGFDNNTNTKMEISPHANHSGGIDVVLPQWNFKGSDNNVGTNVEVSLHANSSDDVDLLSHQGIFEGFDNNTSSVMWIPPRKNHRDGDNTRIRCQNNIGGNLDEYGMGSANPNSVDNNDGSNFNQGLSFE